ncbi:MAG: peptidylprolyl isomerase, partial [Tenacibaculum sp.]|nr:peptidylprolyl isomerase [Tenacibaculum sp.]
FQTTGIFDKAKFKEYLAKIKADNGDEWKMWQNYMSSLKQNLQVSTYTNLVKAGLNSSINEGKIQYFNEYTRVDADFVYVPYSSVKDDLITVTKNDVQNYINSHKDDFQVEASRDIEYVKFEIKPSQEDKAKIKTEVANLLNDKEEYSSVTKGKITVKGLKNTTEYNKFLQDNNSDLALDTNAKFKSQIAKVIAGDIFAGEKGDVFGPYEDKGYYKISKITSTLRLPDSVEASHILIPYKGSLRASTDIARNKKEAKKLADSLLLVVKKNVSKFPDLAKEFSSDKGSSNKGGKYEWFGYNMMTPAFRDFCFENKKGDIDVVETPFGYHVIKIDGQKNFQKAVKLATFARKIEASEVTENEIYQNSETFALELSKGKKLDKLAKENNLSYLPVQGLKYLDENIPSLGNERQIVLWAFGKDNKVGDSKRFDVNGGYVVAVLTGKTEKGLMPVEKAMAKVRPILTKEKKASIIEGKMNGSTLQDIAKATNERVRSESGVSLGTPAISGVGREPKVAGAMINAPKNKVINKVVGDKGVFAFKVTNKTFPKELPNYNTYKSRIATQREGQTYKIYDAIKKSSDIENNMGYFYGVE